jgi:orotidine-5'-phosphate decarboxylase
MSGTAKNAAQRIYCALDMTDGDAAAALAGRLAGTVGGVKLGLEFFGAQGPAGVAAVKRSGLPLFLDLKFHDIPNTVAGAVRAVLPLAPALLTVHASGGRAMLEAARDAAAAAGAHRPKITAFTVLTSLDDGDLDAVGQRGPALDQAKRLAAAAQSAGVDGAVCTPQEVRALRAQCGRDFLLVVPGIRPAWAAAGDQKRVMTPAEALAAGADHLVIGRPITTDPHPAPAGRRLAGVRGA